jgi:DNA-binding transcriptional MerR regulator
LARKRETGVTASPAHKRRLSSLKEWPVAESGDVRPAALVRRSIVIESRECVKETWWKITGKLRIISLSRAAMPVRPDSNQYSISDLAREFALTTRAIRFYEDEGLVSPRRSGRSRIYGERDRVRIKLILRGKRLGLSLTEIRELLDLYDVSRSERPQLMKFLQVLAARRAMLKQQLEDIGIVLAEIDTLERQCRKRLRQAPDDVVGGPLSGSSRRD